MSVQNLYNVARRGDDAIVDLTAAQDIGYVPYFPLGGFSPLQSEALWAVADGLGATPMAVALAWLLRRSPNILLIPGTSSVAHLRENVAAAALQLPDEAIERLDAIGGRHRPLWTPARRGPALRLARRSRVGSSAGRAGRPRTGRSR